MSDAKSLRRNRETFTDAFRKAVEGLDRDVVCTAVKISRPTYDRWLSGLTVPHPVARPSVFTALEALRGH
jgi:hypothetical protein